MTAPSGEEQNKKQIGERISMAIASILSKESLERLLNIKAVDIERYYKIEPILLEHYKTAREKISDSVFLEILRSTEQKKNKVIYTRKSDLLELDDFD